MSVGIRDGRIDLMRGISILLVLLHHFNIAYPLEDTALARTVGWSAVHAVVRNGNYAVTAFFTISGFLITTNAVRRWNGLGRIRVRAFYRYRAARIMPCVVLLLLVVNLLAALGLGMFRNHPEFGGPVPFVVVDLASLFFCMNVLMAHSGWLNYVLCVQWSLAVEEVFYLSFPLLCVALKRDGRLLAVWAVFVAIGPVWRLLHGGSEYEEFNSYLSCFDGIALGCCAAVLGRHLRLPVRVMRPLQDLTAVGMAWFYLSAPITDTAVLGVSLMAGGTAILLVDGARQRVAAPPTRILAPLRRCGRLSYELYLFHLVVLGLLRTVWTPDATVGNAKLALLAVYLVLSIALAAVVCRWYSDPLNRFFRVSATTSAEPVPVLP